jgi:hypothetical protein
MKLRFIEYHQSIYIVIGITYDSDYHYPAAHLPLAFVAVPLGERHRTVYSALLDAYSIKIPFEDATEITDKNRIGALMVLYGD